MTLTVSPDTLTASPASEPSPAWYVRTSLFRDGGQSVSGPYSARGDADAARDAMEWMTGRKFWVDSRAESALPLFLMATAALAIIVGIGLWMRYGVGVIALRYRQLWRG